MTQVIDTMQDVEKSAMRKVLLRIVALMGVFYVTNLLDRFNVGYAALAMNDDLGLTAAQFGLGAGIFFAGYLLAELPSNLALMKFGARIWIARIMITWGLVSACTALVNSAHTFYIIRFLLGIAEAGFLPGAMLYLATWVPSAHRSKAVLLFFAIGQFAALGGPIVSGWILAGDGLWGMKNWQTLFVLEALPTILLGIAVFWILPNGPGDVKWLKPQEREWLQGELAKDSKKVAAHGFHGLAAGLTNPNVWALFASKFANGLAVFTVGLWLPQIARETTHLPIEQLGLLITLPSILVMPTMWIIGNYSDRTGKRPQHTAMALGLCALSASGAALSPFPYVSLGLIFLASISAVVATAVSWAIAPSFLQGRAAAGGFAIVNAGGVSGGFVGGYVIGLLRQHTGDHNFGLYLVAFFCVVGACSVLTLRKVANDDADVSDAAKA